MQIAISKPVNFDLLREELEAVFPAWAAGTAGFRPLEFYTSEEGTYAEAPDGTDIELFQSIVDAHDPSGVSELERLNDLVAEAYGGISEIPLWATWTAEQAHEEITNAVFQGLTVQELHTWIDTNINAATVAALRTQIVVALKMIVEAIVALRTVNAQMGKMLAWLRDLVVVAARR